MTTDFVRRQIDRLLSQAEQAIDDADWAAVSQAANKILALDPENADAPALLAAAERALAQSSSPARTETPRIDAAPPVAPAEGPQPGAAPVRITPSEQPQAVAACVAPVESFAAGRYAVRKFLGDGGKKKVFLAHDARLDRDVAFALIKTEGLDAVGRERITREAQAMGRLGAHPHIVSVFDLGEHDGQPYIVTEFMASGDVEGLLAKAGRPLPVARSSIREARVCSA